jgi:hypothetical protein
MRRDDSATSPASKFGKEVYTYTTGVSQQKRSCPASSAKQILVRFFNSPKP